MASWRKREGMTQAELAETLGCSQSYVSQMERANDAIIPGPAIMIALYELSHGEIDPNSFYDLPDIKRKAA